MYPPEAVGEFYPSWLIALADAKGCTLKELHALCTPVMDAMGYNDKGEAWAREHQLLDGFSVEVSL
jgi:hypothetical protein